MAVQDDLESEEAPIGVWRKKFRPAGDLDTRTKDIEKAIEELEDGIREDASTLIDLSSFGDKEILMLSEPVSLGSTARQIWSKLGENLSGSGGSEGSAVEKATRDCGDAMSELGRAAQAKFKGERGDGDDLASAGEKARQAVENLTKTYSEAAGEVLDGDRIDVAWRKDALRAILALEQAPEALQREIRKQRLLSLTRELRILGLEKVPSELITEKMLKERRVARAKELHPDTGLVRDEKTSAFAGKPTTGGPSAGFFGVLGGILGRLTGQAEADALADEDITMAELNAAYETVKKVVSKPVG